MAPDAEFPSPWVADQTVGSVLDRTAEQYPDRDALVFPAPGTALVVARAGRAREPRRDVADRGWASAGASTSASGR